MYWMYVHIKAVTDVNFQNKQDFLPKLIRQKYKRKCQTRIYSWCLPRNVCDVLPCQLNMSLDHACWCRKKPSLPCEKRITKTQELWTNKWCHNPLCTEILMIYGIMNLHNHMYFFRYLDVFAIHSGVSISINSADTLYLNSLQNPFSNQWLYFLVTLYHIC